MIPRVLIVAGSDSGGGAGIQADIRTVTMFGGHPMTAVTAITAQNTLGVQAVMPVPAEMVLAQIDAVVGDLGVDAVKIGMIGSAAVAEAVADVLTALSSSPRRRGPISLPFRSSGPSVMGPRFRGDDEGKGGGDGEGSGGDEDGGGGDGRGRIPIVFDPVMVATSGAVLADAATIAAFARLMAIATLVTPNLPELAALGGEAAVRASGAAVLVKGGHGAGDRIEDRLVDAAGRETVWRNPRIDTRHTHGTGCTLASGIAVGLAAGMPLVESIGRAIDFVRAGLAHAPGLGAGHGPLGHALGRVPFEDCARCRD